MIRRITKGLARFMWFLGTCRGAGARTVAITGAPRSGTTWLLEMIERATGARRIWEPFYIKPSSSSRASNFGLGWRPYLSPDSSEGQLQAFLGEIFSGKADSLGAELGLSAHGRIRFAARMMLASATVVKFVRLQRLLPWMTRRFNVPVVLLVRHPLAVVASQINHPAWKDGAPEHPILCHEIRNNYPELSPFVDQLDTLEERLAATWAFDYFIPFSYYEQLDGVMIVTYTDMVDSAKTVLEAVLEFLGLLDNPAVRRGVLEEPSATTRDDSNVAMGENPLATWRERLDRAKVDRIQRVADRFGLNPYDEDFRPRWEQVFTKYGVVE